MNREENIALQKGLSALDALSEAWAAEVGLDAICANLAKAPDVPAAIRAMVVQAWVEGAYAGRTSPRAAPEGGQDGERYRWLRERWGRIAETYVGDSSEMEYIGDDEDGWEVDPMSLDACIDAAIERDAARGVPVGEETP